MNGSSEPGDQVTWEILALTCIKNRPCSACIQIIFMYSKLIVLGIQEWRAGQICHSRMYHTKQLSADGNLRFGDVSGTALALHWASWGKVNAHSMVSVHFQEFPSHGHYWIRVPVSPALTLLQSHFLFLPSALCLSSSRTQHFLLLLPQISHTKY